MYGKLYENMFSGSMIGSGATNFALMSFVIAHCKPPSYEVELNPMLLAFIIGEPEEKIVSTIEKMCSPDHRSRSETEQGRKLLRRGTYLYFVVNGEAYANMRSDADRKAYWRDQKKRQKMQKAGASATANVPQGTTPEAPPKENNASYHKDSRTVLHLVSEHSGKKFFEADTHLSPISARLNERGVDLDGVKLMLKRQWALWENAFTNDEPPKPMREYFQPSTLFRPKNFGNYYASKDQPISKPQPKPDPADRNANNSNRNVIGQYDNMGKVFPPTKPATP